jgi:hypothetical protein
MHLHPVCQKRRARQVAEITSICREPPSSELQIEAAPSARDRTSLRHCAPQGSGSTTFCAFFARRIPMRHRCAPAASIRAASSCVRDAREKPQRNHETQVFCGACTRPDDGA